MSKPVPPNVSGNTSADDFSQTEVITVLATAHHSNKGRARLLAILIELQSVSLLGRQNPTFENRSTTIIQYFVVRGTAGEVLTQSQSPGRGPHNGIVKKSAWVRLPQAEWGPVQSNKPYYNSGVNPSVETNL
jgi:hypothetical protein